MLLTTGCLPAILCACTCHEPYSLGFPVERLPFIGPNISGSRVQRVVVPCFLVIRSSVQLRIYSSTTYLQIACTVSLLLLRKVITQV